MSLRSARVLLHGPDHVTLVRAGALAPSPVPLWKSPWFSKAEKVKGPHEMHHVELGGQIAGVATLHKAVGMLARFTFILQRQAP